MLEGMSLGLTPTQADVFTTTTGFCESRVSPDSIYGLLHRECFRLFPDEMFADLFADSGRNCVPPMIVAVVMVLQRFEGCSDREAVDRFAFDARWKYAAGGLSFDYPVVRAYGAGRYARPASGLGASGQDLRGGAGDGEGGWVWSAVGGCWTRRRCMTRSRRWTRSR